MIYTFCDWLGCDNKVAAKAKENERWNRMMVCAGELNSHKIVTFHVCQEHSERLVSSFKQREGSDE